MRLLRRLSLTHAPRNDAGLGIYEMSSMKGKGYHLNSKMSGFSILELILALGITAVMAGSVFMVYTHAVRLESRSRELNEVTLRSYMIFKTIEDDIGRSVAYRFRAGDGNGEVPAFLGEKDRLAFVTETDQGLRWVDYSLDEPETEGTVRTTIMGRRYSRNEDQVLSESITENKTRAFKRQLSLFDAATPDDSRHEQTEIIVPGVGPEDISFQYARSQKQSGLAWAASWYDLDLPSAIRVDVRLYAGQSQQGIQYSKVIVLPTGF